MLYEKLYAELGKLLYAVASADGIISEKEKTKLHHLVTNELAPIEKHKDQFGTNSSYFIEMELELLDDQIVKPEEALDSFSEFIEDHFLKFDQNMKHICLRVLEELDIIYSKTSKKEKSFIKQLKNKLVEMEISEMI